MNVPYFVSERVNNISQSLSHTVITVNTDECLCSQEIPYLNLINYMENMHNASTSFHDVFLYEGII